MTIIVIAVMLMFFLMLGALAYVVLHFWKKQIQDEQKNLQKQLQEEQTQANLKAMLSEIRDKLLLSEENLAQIQKKIPEAKDFAELTAAKVGENTLEKMKSMNDYISERMGRLEKTSEKMESLHQEILKNSTALNDLFSDKKSRGVFGEISLHLLLQNALGEESQGIYKLQHSFSTGVRADAAIFSFGKEQGEVLCIDSKFPLDNYRKMLEPNLSEVAKKEQSKLFELALKKHTDDIASKYIITGETTDYALMFLPAEGVFSEVQARYYSVVEYSQKKRVWIVSPCTLLAILGSFRMVLRSTKQTEGIREIQKDLAVLSQEFQRYGERWDTLVKRIDSVQSQAKEVDITGKKIQRSFKKIVDNPTTLPIDTNAKSSLPLTSPELAPLDFLP